MNHFNPTSLWIKPLHPDIKSLDLPLNQATLGSAGVDLRCIGDSIIQPGGTLTIPTGLAIWIEKACLMGLVVPRSSLGKRGFTLQNTVGIIDSDYQGELLLQVFNRGPEVLCLKHLDRVAQLILVQIANIEATMVVEEFPQPTARGTGGFGSTGT